MARKLRIHYAGAIYQVLKRGDHQEHIFGDGHDWEQYLTTLAVAGSGSLFVISCCEYVRC